MKEKKKSLTGSPGVDDFRTSDTFVKNHCLPVSGLGLPTCCAFFRLAIPSLGEMQLATPSSCIAHLTPQERVLPQNSRSTAPDFHSEWASLVAQKIKNLPTMRETGV